MTRPFSIHGPVGVALSMALAGRIGTHVVVQKGARVVVVLDRIVGRQVRVKIHGNERYDGNGEKVPPTSAKAS